MTAREAAKRVFVADSRGRPTTWMLVDSDSALSTFTGTPAGNVFGTR
ncbi:MAG: hypothetical protein JWO62_2992 [Acidimicrobiaceae bacterium]|jgi:hypothetical protein|nr:hypothetical protein [Acidimicrobiaceae bacterium]